MYCVKCGNELMNDERICSKCGYKRITPNKEQVQYNSSTMDKKTLLLWEEEKINEIDVHPDKEEGKEKEFLIEMRKVETEKARLRKRNLVVLLVAGIIAIVGIILLYVSVHFFRESNQKLSESEKENQNKNDETEIPIKKEANSIKLILRQKHSEGYTTEWLIEEDTVIPARTTGIFTVTIETEPTDAELPEITWVAENDKVKIENNVIEVLDTKDYGNSKITANWENGTITFYLDIQHAGWNKMNGNWFFVSGSGTINKNRWRKDGDNWRYLNEGGLAVTGWQEIEGKKYYFDKNARVVTGVQEIDGQTYTFDENGVLQ